MAPVAGHLANGVGLGDLGPAAEGLEMLAGASGAEATGGSIIGRVLHVDRFGTLVTNIRREQLQNVGEGRGICEVHVNGQSVGAIRATFSDVGAGEPVALIGGFGLLEIAINSGRAVERFGPVESVRVECR